MLYFYPIFTEICSHASSYEYARIGLDDGLATNRRQVIISINVALFADADTCMRHSASVG